MLRGEEQGLAALPRLLRPGHQLVIVPAHAARMSAGAARVRFCLSWLHSWSLQAHSSPQAFRQKERQPDMPEAYSLQADSAGVNQ